MSAYLGEEDLPRGIIVGDCLAVMADMPDGCVDLVITSPPYNALNTVGGGWTDQTGQHFRRRSDRPSDEMVLYDSHDDAMPVDEYIQWQRDCLAEMMRVVSDDGAIFYMHRRRVQQDVMEDHARDILEIAPAYGFRERQIIDWVRNGGHNHNPGYLLPCQEQLHLLAKPGRFRHIDLGKVPAAFCLPSVNTRRGQNLPPQFPVEIPRALLAAVRPTPRSDGKHGLVLDPFGGSGTVAEAAVLEGWDYIHVDISASYCDYARKRVTGASSSQDTQSQDTQSQDTQSQDTQGWDAVSPRWEALDKAVFDRISETQSASKMAAVPLDQQALADELGVSLRSVNGAVAKLKNAGSVKVLRQRRAPGLYSVSSEIPRWPVRVAGGSDVALQDTQQDTQSRYAMPRDPGDPGAGLNQENPIEINHDIKPGSRDPGAQDTQNQDAQTVCPLHQDGACCGPTQYWSLKKAADARGDLVTYCWGETKCSWVHSRLYGEIVEPGLPRLSAQDLTSRYYDLAAAAKSASAPPVYYSVADPPPESGPRREAPCLNWIEKHFGVRFDVPRDDGEGAMRSRPDAASAWQAALGRLQLEIPKEQFDTFLRPCCGLGWIEDCLYVGAATTFAVSWLELPLHLEMVREAVTKTTGAPLSVRYLAIPESGLRNSDE